MKKIKIYLSPSEEQILAAILILSPNLGSIEAVAKLAMINGLDMWAKEKAKQFIKS